jgi:hypothetical protein
LARKEKQLYCLLDRLSNYVENRDELGSIIGYAVIGSLIDFETNSRDQQEIQFEEIKSVYSGIENAIHTCRKQTNSYEALCDLHLKVQPYMNDQIKNNDIPNTNSNLLTNIVNNLINRRGNYEDKLRRNGLAILEQVLERGPLRRKIDVLNRDHTTIKTYFSN